MSAQHRINSGFAMKRAHQLATWNRVEKAPFGKWLCMAWQELKAGDFAGWSFDLPPAESHGRVRRLVGIVEGAFS